ncbi:MAG: NAD(P)H-binding protein [Candidatus Melainabacteria bacterium]|nr:NAD(P)H-binding protein [Candidatus Melainabacteria bacterium]
MILLLGATGLLGGQVLRRLVDKKYPTKLFIRGSSDWKDASIQNLRHRGVDISVADVTDKEAVLASLVDCTAVINIVGSMRPNKNIDLQQLQVTAVKNLVAAAQRRGVQRFVHISCLGASSSSSSEYFRTKWESEKLVREAEHYWTIFRPSYMFGERFPFLDVIMPLIKFRMCMPVLGSGMNQIQPIWVDNVAECVVDSIYRKECVGQTFELGGPETYSMLNFMEKVRKELGITGPTFNITTPTVAKASAALSKLVPGSAISEEVVNLIMANSFTELNAAQSSFVTKLAPLDEMFERIMDTY